MVDSRTSPATASDAPALTGVRAGAFTAYRVLIVILLVAILVQVFLAGLGVFGTEVAPTDDGSTELDAHRTFGHIITTPGAVLLLVAALVARPGRRIVPLTVAWVVLGVIQVALAIAGGDTPFLGGLHALTALVFLGLTVELTRRADPGLLR